MGRLHLLKNLRENITIWLKNATIGLPEYGAITLIIFFFCMELDFLKLEFHAIFFFFFFKFDRA